MVRGSWLIQRWLPHAQTATEARVCMYGDSPGALENCEVLVEPGQGWRHNGLVFCSEEHAARDADEQRL